jgi:hypothetical protein
MSAINTQMEARKALYTEVRAAFVGQGTTLNAWCLANGTRIQNVRAAFFGEWSGPKAEELRARVISAAGVLAA